MDEMTTLPPPPTTERCYRHPNVETGVHCTRCGRPICPDCMIPAPVGHQCPECVNEARREFRQGPGRRIAVANVRRRATATSVLLGLIVAMFVVEILNGGGDIINGPSPAQLVKLGASIGLFQTSSGAIGGIAAGQYWRLVSSMFLHAGILHIAFNAYALWIFGSIIEQELGRFRLVLIYVVTGLFASAASYAFGSPFAPAVGASGAIFGLFGAFIAYNYRRRHLALAAARLRQAMVLIAINAFIAISIPVIDWRAHAGGLAAGLVAGYVVEGTGSASTRRAILVIGTTGLLAGVVGLVVWRTAQLHAQFPF
ncbi:MAG: rhomboid family intramembrane serine protease [Actinomycetota bacterium]